MSGGSRAARPLRTPPLLPFARSKKRKPGESLTESKFDGQLDGGFDNKSLGLIWKVVLLRMLVARRKLELW